MKAVFIGVEKGQRVRLQHQDIQRAHENVQMEMEERKWSEREKDPVIVMPDSIRHPKIPL